MNARAAGLLALALGAGCAYQARQPASAPSPEAELTEALQQLEAAKRQFAAARAGDCPEVCRLAKLVCTAGERICAIAKRHDEEPSFGAACERATVDCRDAQTQCTECR